MPRRKNQSQNLCREPRQIDLFALGSPEGADGTPAWPDLPSGTSDALTRLLVKPITEHRRQSHHPGRRWAILADATLSGKIQAHHLERKAILYVRQSSAHQVLHNRESSTLQYAMRGRLTALGWSEIETIDDDLGCSAAGSVQRAGFERMVAEVWQRRLYEFRGYSDNADKLRTGASRMLCPNRRKLLFLAVSFFGRATIANWKSR